MKNCSVVQVVFLCYESRHVNDSYIRKIHKQHNFNYEKYVRGHL